MASVRSSASGSAASVKPAAITIGADLGQLFRTSVSRVCVLASAKKFLVEKWPTKVKCA